jgi:hypothetical protein
VNIKIVRENFEGKSLIKNAINKFIKTITAEIKIPIAFRKNFFI